RQITLRLSEAGPTEPSPSPRSIRRCWWAPAGTSRARSLAGLRTHRHRPPAPSRESCSALARRSARQRRRSALLAASSSAARGSGSESPSDKSSGEPRLLLLQRLPRFVREVLRGPALVVLVPWLARR